MPYFLPEFRIIHYYIDSARMQEQAFNWYEGTADLVKRYMDTDKDEVLSGIEKYFKEEGGKQAVSQDDFKTMEASGPVFDKCTCTLTCANDAMFGGKCNRNADQEDRLCTPCRGYAIMAAQDGPRKVHCHGCDWGMEYGHYSEARAAEDIWTPKRPGEGEPDLY